MPAEGPVSLPKDRAVVHKRFEIGAAVAIAIAVAVAAGSWLHLSYVPNTGNNIYDDEAAFKAYVASLGLASGSIEAARNRLMLEGFRCELFADGGASCERFAQGSNCGERQFVDLTVPGPTGSTHAVSTRFGLVCR